MMSLCIVPVTLAQAQEFVRRIHRTHKRSPPGWLFGVGVESEGTLVGVAIVGFPAARALNTGRAAEIRRVATDGTHNACSMLYGACRRAARSLGYSVIYTYTLPEEGGASLRAAGFTLDKDDAGGPAYKWHNREGRSAEPAGDDLVGGKWRWIA
jgi:hypothetical protein